jgi:UDP-N-acetylglucosamine acyltransferase
MSVTIHPTAIVDPKAELASGVEIGPFAIIEANTVVGEGTKIMQNVFIASGARIGKNCVIHPSAVIANVPQDLKFKGTEKTYVEIGDNTTIREFATLHRATIHEAKGNSGTKDGVTRVGSNCLIMAYAHVAHDCLVGDNVIIANAVQMGGHTTIGYHATVGGITGIHQFSQIGAHAMVGAGQLIVKDIPPYALIGGSPATFSGINRIGLMRRGFSDDAIKKIRTAYKLLYNSGHNFTDAIGEIESSSELSIPECKLITEFFRKSDRGVIGR